MKSKFVLLVLVAAPTLAVAQTQATPTHIAKAPAEPLPLAQELLDNLFTPYETAKTFRGNFAISIKAKQNAIAEIQLETLFRYDDKGVLDGQNSTMKVVGRAKPKTKQSFVFVNQGSVQKVVLVEQKAWWIASERDNASALAVILKPLIDQVVEALENRADFEPVVTSSREAGRPVFVLKAKKGNLFRAVIDAQTRAIRSLDVKDNISIDGKNQVFNEPVAEQELTWIEPSDFRQVAPGEVAPPASLGISIAGIAATPTG